MPASIDDWSDQHWDRTFAQQTSQVDTVKLIVTFALGFSATIVATALQVEPQNGWDAWAVWLLGGAFLLAIASILLDRLQWPVYEDVRQKQTDSGWTEPELVDYIRMLLRDTEKDNRRVVGQVRRAAEYQVILSATAAMLAFISLFQ